MHLRYLAWTVALALLAGCSASPPNDGVIVEQTPLDSPGGNTALPADSGAAGTTASDTVLITQASGLTERLPNTCKLENYQYLQGQSAATLNTAGLDRPWRIVGPDTIVSQEYNPARLNFTTNRSGSIQRITCG